MASETTPVPPGAAPAAAAEPPACEVQAAPTPTGSAPDLRADCRARLLAQFAAWLDEALADEALPLGLDQGLVADFLAPDADQEAGEPPDGCSLYDLWAAMTALTQEVKLQGRTFRQLSEAVAPVAGLDGAVRAVLAAHGEALTTAIRLAGDLDAGRKERQRDAIREAERRAGKASTEAIMDARDRLKRGLATAEAAGAIHVGRWEALLAPGARRATAAAAALREGYAMALARLDECLREQGIREIATANAAFDPRRMRAVEAVVTDTAAEGTVIEVLRPGYESDTEVVRVAEVRVARKA